MAHGTSPRPTERRRRPSGSPPVAPDQVCGAHLGLPNQPGDDGRRLPWNSNNSMSASTCTGGAA